jgi:hypothetical protein
MLISYFKKFKNTNSSPKYDRNCETTSLKLGDFHLAAGLRDEQRGSSELSSSQFFKVKLRNRKNWQKRMKNGDQQTSG